MPHLRLNVLSPRGPLRTPLLVSLLLPACLLALSCLRPSSSCALCLLSLLYVRLRLCPPPSPSPPSPLPPRWDGPLTRPRPSWWTTSSPTRSTPSAWRRAPRRAWAPLPQWSGSARCSPVGVSRSPALGCRGDPCAAQPEPAPPSSLTLDASACALVSPPHTARASPMGVPQGRDVASLPPPAVGWGWGRVGVSSPPPSLPAWGLTGWLPQLTSPSLP